MKKTGFTVEEHRQAGLTLALMRDELINLQVKYGNAYPQAAGFEPKLEKIVTLIDRLRASLDDQVSIDDRKNPPAQRLDNDGLNHLYYPTQEQRKAGK